MKMPSNNQKIIVLFLVVTLSAVQQSAANLLHSKAGVLPVKQYASCVNYYGGQIGDPVCDFYQNSGLNNVLQCNDGTRCNVMKSGWDCCASGIKRCPKNKPIMCANKDCNGDYCCDLDYSVSCCSHGGRRHGCAVRAPRWASGSSSSGSSSGSKSGSSPQTTSRSPSASQSSSSNKSPSATSASSPNSPSKTASSATTSSQSNSGSGTTQAPSNSSSSNTTTYTDFDILNFALNLECLEAEFYSWAVNGHGLTASQLGNGPTPIGGQKANLSEEVLYYASEVAQNELNHVEFLRTALGSKAVACPTLNVGNAFATVFSAASGIKNVTFSPYANDIAFLLGSFIFEDVGVTAYHGAAPLVKSPTILSAAAGILGVEAYHAATIRTLLFQKRNVTVVDGYNVGQVVKIISDFRANNDGQGSDDYGVVNSDGSAHIVPADSNSLVFSRTPAQVKRLVAGTFLPNGTTGYF